MPHDFQWPAYVGPSSPVVDKIGDWRNQMILLPHEALRWYSKELSEVIAAFEPIEDEETVWKIDALFDLIDDYFLQFLHVHHDLEEEVLHPMLRREGQMTAIEDGMQQAEKEHEELLKYASGEHSVSSYREGIKNLQPDSLQAFKESMREMLRVLDSHMANEELLYPVGLQGISELGGEWLETYGVVAFEGTKWIKSLPDMVKTRGVKKWIYSFPVMFLPVLYYTMCMWKGQPAAKVWLQKLPAAVQGMFETIAVPKFYLHQLRVLRELKTGVAHTKSTATDRAVRHVKSSASGGKRVGAAGVKCLMTCSGQSTENLPDGMWIIVYHADSVGPQWKEYETEAEALAAFSNFDPIQNIIPRVLFNPGRDEVDRSGLSSVLQAECARWYRRQTQPSGCTCAAQ